MPRCHKCDHIWHRGPRLEKPSREHLDIGSHSADKVLTAPRYSPIYTYEIKGLILSPANQYFRTIALESGNCYPWTMRDRIASIIILTILAIHVWFRRFL